MTQTIIILRLPVGDLKDSVEHAGKRDGLIKHQMVPCVCDPNHGDMLAAAFADVVGRIIIEQGALLAINDNHTAWRVGNRRALG